MAESAILCVHCSGQQADEAVQLGEEDSDGSLDNGDGPLPSKRPRPLLCSLCSGIHDDDYLRPLVARVTALLEQEAYSVATFSLALKFPPGVLVRQHALGLYLSRAVCLKALLRARLAHLLTAALGLEHCGESQFCITLEFSDGGQGREAAFLLPLLQGGGARGRGAGPGLTQGGVAKVLDSVTQEDYVRYLYWPPPPLDTRMTLASMRLAHEPVYVSGHYTKHSRTLSQTPWVVDGERKTPTSVQELLATPLLAAYGAEESKFSAAGREDADVRMLGAGRPFLLELLNPRRPSVPPEEIQRVAERINACRPDLLGVRGLCAAEKSWCDRLKQGEEDKRKTYCALVRCQAEVLPEAVAGLQQHKDLLLQQKTPLRVLHRRCLATRERSVYWMSGQCVGGDRRHFKLRLCTQAGTYVKEFVHGDLGRTRPSLSALLGQPADIVALDVEEVEMVWPPRT